MLESKIGFNGLLLPKVAGYWQGFGGSLDPDWKDPTLPTAIS
jgi:hypothetical protein